MAMSDELKQLRRAKRRRQPPSDPIACAKMALKLAAAATVGPWNACHSGKCSCKQVWTADHPIAKIENGEWGDEWPSIRLTGETSMDKRAEAYMEKFAYGSIPDTEATANARLVAFSRTAIVILANAILGKTSSVANGNTDAVAKISRAVDKRRARSHRS